MITEFIPVYSDNETKYNLQSDKKWSAKFIFTQKQMLKQKFQPIFSLKLLF